MTTRHFIIATAGHVDHGKSALVKALTGTDPDRLPEEKRRQITIDLGFAKLNLTAPSGDKIHAGIVDVPGHEDFVRNMIAGVGSIDLALLVIAADDGWMPQTEEHLQILTYLGVEQAVIALAKSDLGKIEPITEQIRNRLRETVLAKSRVIPTSVRTGEGIENLKKALVLELATMPTQRDFGKPRLFVDRAFTLRGVGTVVTGTLTGGRLHRGQSISVQPLSVRARIRSIQSHGAEIDCAQPGMRTALSLPDLPIDQVKRGDAITDSDLAPTLALIAQIEKSPRVIAKELAARPLKNGSSVHLHHGTSRVAARITLLEKKELEPGQKTIAHLKLASPIFAFVGDRFIIRDASEQHTIAGGGVLDPDVTGFRDARDLKLLSMRATASDDVDLCVRSEIARRGFVLRKMLLNKSHFSADEISEALMRLQRDNKIVLLEEIAADGELWQTLRNQAIALIDNAHKQNPERPGLDLNELRSVLRDQPANVFEALIAELCDDNFARKGSAIAQIAHRPALPIELQPVERKICEALAKEPFDPPPRREIEADLHAQRVLRFLIEAGEVSEVGSDVILLRENFERMKEAVVDIISLNGPATVSDLRQRLQSSRRIMVPLLERLDRDGVTRRVGDKRTLGQII
ncbi:MAG: selenocysteine-specific translation elongation factor [Verrucomicrobia bacterium]|nr:MAG: selenocysteine-specific translation elongation factor [Verrucomicrobiota bacterium]